MPKKKRVIKEQPGNPQILLRLPPELGMPLLADATKEGCTVQAIILGIVADHYGVESASPRRGKPKGTK